MKNNLLRFFTEEIHQNFLKETMESLKKQKIQA